MPGFAERGAVKRLLHLAWIVVLLGLSSCHGAAPASTAVTCTTATGTTTSTTTSSCIDPVTNISVTISPATVSVNVVTTYQFQSAVTGGTNGIVIWKVNNITGGNSNIGQIDSNGLYHAPPVVPSPSTISVSATSFEDQNVSAISTVTILPAPTVTISPTTLTITSGTANTQTFTSTVTGTTTTNVDWEVNNILGGNSTFGTISAAGVYTAPKTPPIGSTVTVTAISRDFPLSTASATVKIAGYSTSSLQGPFAFTVAGRNLSGSSAGPFFRAGSFVADGSGHMDSGVEDINDALGVTTNPVSFAGTYTVGPDGRGTMAFNDGRASTPASFDFVLVNGTQLQITGFDASGTSSGQANLQDVSKFIGGLSGKYVFDFTGVHGSNALSQIGEFTTDGAGNVTSGMVDVNDGGVVTPQAAITGGAYSASADSNGRGTITLNTLSTTLHFSYYLVSPGLAKLVETDAARQVTGVISQQAPNTVFDAASLNGNYAFLLAGSGASTYAAAGSFSADGNSHVTAGELDENAGGTPTANLVISGSYTVDANGRGTAAFTGGRTYVFYLGPSGTAVFQETDSIHSGVAIDGAFQAQQNASFAQSQIAGNFAFSTAGLSASSVETIAGELAADGAGAVPSGAVDMNTAGTLAPGVAITTGSYAASSSAERGTLTLSLATSPTAQTRNFAVYVVSATQVFLVEIDANRIAAGSLFRQF